MPYHETHSTGDPRWWSVREEIRLRHEQSVIAGAGSPPSEAEVRQAEKDGKPMHCDTYPVRLDTVRDVLAKYHKTSQEEWQRAQQLPEYVRRDPRELGNMGIGRMPGLLGPEQGGEIGRLCWRVAIHGNEDRAQVGRIVAWERPSGQAFVEFWLDNFPDFNMFREMRDMAVQAIEYRAFWMVEKLTFESILQIQVKATLEDLDRCLQEFKPPPVGKAWGWAEHPITFEFVPTRLALCPGGIVCQGSRIWCVEALDVPYKKGLAAPFCTISAEPIPFPPGRLRVICWPDWREETAASYWEYLWKLMSEFQRRAFIRDLPVWLTEPGRVKIPETARKTWAEPAAEVAQTETLPVKEDASAPPPVQSEPTGAPAPSQAQTEPPPHAKDSAPESPLTGNAETPTTDIDRLLSDRRTMRRYFKDYEPDTAKKIIAAIPEAWESYKDAGGQWGPQYIAKQLTYVGSTTVGRYLRAFKEAGITETNGIEIPHRRRKNPVNNPRQIHQSRQ